MADQDTKTVTTNFESPESVTTPGSVRKHSWAEFRDEGFLWLVNRSLHLYGWAIVMEFDDDTNELNDVYPVRCEWRGFPPENEARGFTRINAWMKKAGRALAEEASR